MDEINAPVVIWGFGSLQLLSFIFGGIAVGMILFIISAVLAGIFILVYVFVMVKVSKYLVSFNKKGVYDPIDSLLTYKQMNISQEADIELIFSENQKEK